MPKKTRPTYSNARAKYYDGVRTLALNWGSLPERLEDALKSQFLTLQDDELPEELHAEYHELHAKVTAVQDQELGSVAATVRQMDDEDVRDVAERFVAMYEALRQYEDD